MCSRGDGPGLPDYADWLMNASWRFAFCANAIKGDLVRRGAFTPAHIRENNGSSQSTLVSPTRLADRASMRGSITLDVVRLLLTTNCSIKRQKKLANLPWLALRVPIIRVELPQYRLPGCRLSLGRPYSFKPVCD
jgi:hypothetical protein